MSGATTADRPNEQETDNAWKDVPLLPVRCWTCRKVIAHLGARYYGLVRGGLTKGDALTACGVRRACCRTQFLTTVDIYSVAENFIERLSDPRDDGSRELK